VCPKATTSYTLKATASSGREETRVLEIQVVDESPVVEFWADSLLLSSGECTTVRWRVQNIDSVYYNGAGVTGYEGSSRECPRVDAVYRLRVRLRDGSFVDRTLTVKVQQQTAEIRFWVDSATIDEGQCTVIHWDVRNIDSVHFDGEGVTGSGERRVCPGRSRDFTLRVRLRDGSSTERTVRIEVRERRVDPTLTVPPTVEPWWPTPPPTVTVAPAPSATPISGYPMPRVP